MNILWITLGIIGVLLVIFILILLFGKAKIRIIADATQVKAYLSLFGIRFWILPLKKGVFKKGKDSRLARRFQRWNDERKELKQQKKALGVPVPNLMENLQLIFTLLKAVQSKLKDKLSIRVRKFTIEVSAADAAQTAVLYGAVVSVCSWFWEWIQATISIVDRKKGAMRVVPNYLKTQSSAKIDIILKMKGLKALFLVFEMIDAYKDESELIEENAKERHDKKQNKKK